MCNKLYTQLSLVQAFCWPQQAVFQCSVLHGYAFKLLMTDEWTRIVGLHYSEHLPAKPITWAGELSEETREVERALRDKWLSEGRQWKVQNEDSCPCPQCPHSLPLSPESPWLCSTSVLPLVFPRLHSDVLSLLHLPIAFPGTIPELSNCHFSWTAETAWGNLGKWAFIIKLTPSTFLLPSCLNVKATNAWKLPSNCTWVSQFH